MPSSWGITLQFQLPPTGVPFDWLKAIRHDSFSTAGARQTVSERLENWLDFQMEWVATGADVSAWDAFIESACLGVPFDFYPDASLANFTTYALMDFDKKLAYKAPGQYTFSITMRKEMQQLVSAPGGGGGGSGAPSSAARWVTFASSAPGNFTLAHPLGYSPNGVSSPVLTSPGAVYFQTPEWDAANLYLVASDAGVTGMVLVW